MKKRIVIGATVLSLAGLLLAGCGGVSQDDLDAAEAATAAAEAATDAAQAEAVSLQTDLDAAEAATDAAQAEVGSLQTEAASLQTDLDAAESDLATQRTAKTVAQADAITTQADLDAALVTITELEAVIAAGPQEPAEEVPAEEVPAIETSFEATTYASEALGVSFQYPADWTVTAYPPSLLYATPADFSSMTIFLAFDIGDAATASELLEVAHPGLTIESETETTTADGTAATQYTVLYEDQGFAAAAWALVVQTDTNWFELQAGGYTAFGAIAEELALEILGTLILD